MVRALYKNSWILMMFTLCWSGYASAAVTAQVDRYHISIDETLNLSIEVSGHDSGDPDFAPLQADFEIISRNQSSSYSLMNGSMSSKSTWLLVLRPRHTGALRIPALLVGKKKTTAIIIQVSQVAIRQQSSKAAPQGDLWIDMRAEPSTVYVQQQSIITLRIYQAISLNQAQLTEPRSDHALVVRLGDDKNYRVNRNGRNWAVTERRYAIFPQQHGTLKLAPVQLDGSIMAGRTYGSVFQTTKPVRVRSNALELQVKAIPSNWKSTSWLPASKVELLESWPNGPFHVGDSITRTLSLRADGLDSSQLPELNTLLPDYLKAYADKPVFSDDKRSNGIIGTRQEKLAILATRPGTFILPAIDVIWWDVHSKRLKTASLPPRTFKVLAAPVANHQLTPPPTKSIIPLQTTAPEQQSRQEQAADNWWKWLAICSSLGWLLTLVWCLRRPKRTAHDSHATHRSPNIDTLKKAVLQACREHQSKACAQALLHFSQAQWPDDRIHSLNAMAARCDTDLAQAINALERHLYAHSDQPTWQADALQSAFEQAAFSTKPTASTTSALPGLYPE